ncbi:MAG: chorismate synthase [Clostridiaceae bacterium]|nr:chorismate synthase [Clostridiaceae bacterium]
MSSIFGDRLKISVFGESHGPAIGVVVDGLPSGIALDFDKIAGEMARRRPDSGPYSTKRKEMDEVEILSGLFNGRTTGTPLSAIIRNKDTISAHYNAMERLARPGHADFSGYVRYKGFNDYRGGGHFSGRLTAPLVFAGAVAKQILEEQQIFIGAHIDSILDIKDIGFDKTNITREQLMALSEMDIPVNDRSCHAQYLEIIDNARKNGDSVGGIIEAAIIGLPAGIGSPIFDNVEAKLSSILFSVPAVKGVEFGEGFSITKMYGSEANDSFYTDGSKIMTRTNNNGGINGGITNGMPVVLRVAIKPTSSISIEQDTVDIKSFENTTIKVHGRHDSCIVPRAVPVVEAACAVAICDLLLSQLGVDTLSEGDW